MATQNRNLYDADEIASIQREYGIPSVGEAMNAAVEETKDAVVELATTVVETPSRIFNFLEKGGAYFVLGFVMGSILTVALGAAMVFLVSYLLASRP